MNYAPNRVCLESCMFTCIQFIPFYFGNIDIYRYSLLYLIHQHIYYAYHRFGHQWFSSHKNSIHSLHHINRKYHNIIEPFGFIQYSIMDQIVPYILFGSKYISIILYLSIIEHIVAHGSMHVFPLECSKIHLFHHKYALDKRTFLKMFVCRRPIKYSYMGQFSMGQFSMGLVIWSSSSEYFI